MRMLLRVPLFRFVYDEVALVGRFGKRRPGAIGTDTPDDAIVDVRDEARRDHLGTRNRQFDTGNVRHRQEKLTRVQALVILLLTLIVVVLANAISDLIPLRRDVPYLLTVNPRTEMVMEMDLLRDTEERTRVIAERTVMKYVQMRHEVLPDAAEMARRWDYACLEGKVSVTDWRCAFVYMYSSAPVYQAFVAQNMDAVQELIEQKTTRRVDIETAPIEQGVDPVFDETGRQTGKVYRYEVRFAYRDYRNDRQGEPRIVRERRFVATLWINFVAEDIKAEHRYLNPFGFKVDKYHLASVEANAGLNAPRPRGQ